MRKLVVLASQSPRRRMLLEQMGLEVKVVAPEIRENPRNGELPEEYVARVALLKAASVVQRTTVPWVIAADTVVVLGAEIIGKPTDKYEAEQILKKLSGKEHSVITGVAVGHHSSTGARWAAQTDRTRVQFYDISPAEIRLYVDSGEPMDKAGAYAIQGLGRLFIKGIQGDYYNVVGLPCAMCARMLAGMGFRLADGDCG
jgi:septum formation protein